MVSYRKDTNVISEFFMKFFMFLMFSFIAVMLNAKTVPFRSGEIYFAETSPYKPEIKNWHTDLFGTDSASLYAGVSAKIHQGRKISIFDYVLELNGNRYACVAIRTDNGEFIYTKDAITAKKDAIYTMLFFLDGATLKKDQMATLISPIDPQNKDNARFTIKNRPSGPPCPYFLIAKEGNF